MKKLTLILPLALLLVLLAVPSTAITDRAAFSAVFGLSPRGSDREVAQLAVDLELSELARTTFELSQQYARMQIEQRSSKDDELRAGVYRANIARLKEAVRLAQKYNFEVPVELFEFIQTLEEFNQILGRYIQRPLPQSQKEGA